MTENDKRIIDELKEKMSNLTSTMTYDFNQERINQKWMDEFKKLPRTFVGQMIEAFHIRFENNIIYITEEMLGFLGALAVLPLEIDEISDTGTYEVYLNNEPWAKIEYSGMPKNDPESHMIHFGVNTQLILNQLVKRIVIDLEIPGGEDNGPSKK